MGRDDDEYTDEEEAEDQLRQDYDYDDENFEELRETGVSNQDALDNERRKDALDELYGN